MYLIIKRKISQSFRSAIILKAHMIYLNVALNIVRKEIEIYFSKVVENPFVALKEKENVVYIYVYIYVREYYN